MNRRVFAASGTKAVLALAASAIGVEFDKAEIAGVEIENGIAVVSIVGPLTHHNGWFFDSYEGIKDRVELALASEAKTVVLKINSPGGDASGVFETSRALKAMTAKAGKTLVAYVDGTAASAGYALASAASSISLPVSAYVGSVGCITTLVDVVEADKRDGLNFAVIASGKRKADGHPHVPIDGEMRAEVQAQIDSLAGEFFCLVAENRNQVPERIQSMEAALFRGESAVKAGLADRVETLEQLLATLASAKAPNGAGEEVMTLEEIVAGLKELADGEGDDADKAKAALKALGEMEPDAEDTVDAEADEKEKPKADEEKPKEEASTVAASGSNPTIDMAAELLKVKADVQEMKTREERTRLLASRPDLMKDPKIKAWLTSASLTEVRNAVTYIPKAPTAKPAAATTPNATRAEGQGTTVSPQAHELDIKMGLVPAVVGVRNEGTRLVMPVMTPAQARAAVAQKGAAK